MRIKSKKEFEFNLPVINEISKNQSYLVKKKFIFFDDLQLMLKCANDLQLLVVEINREKKKYTVGALREE